MKTIDPEFIPLKSEFRKDGFDFRLIKRQGRVALFQKSKQNITTEHFEVVLVRQNPASERFGRLFPDSESIPCSNEWGERGWSYSDRESAEKAFLIRCEA